MKLHTLLMAAVAAAFLAGPALAADVAPVAPATAPAKHRFRCDMHETPAYKYQNPDGSEGGWVAVDAIIEPGATIDAKAEVASGSTLGHGSDLRGAVSLCDRSVVIGNSFILAPGGTFLMVTENSWFNDVNIAAMGTLRATTMDGSTISSGEVYTLPGTFVSAAQISGRVILNGTKVDGGYLAGPELGNGKLDVLRLGRKVSVTDHAAIIAPQGRHIDSGAFFDGVKVDGVPTTLEIATTKATLAVTVSGDDVLVVFSDSTGETLRLHRTAVEFKTMSDDVAKHLGISELLPYRDAIVALAALAK